MVNFDEYILHRPPAVPTENAGICFLLHGRFADAATIFSIEHLLPKQFHIVAIRGPYPMKENKFQWFTPYDMTHPVESFSAEQYVQSLDWISKLMMNISDKYHIDTGSQFALGFSQGAAMCYLLGLSGKVNLRGVVAMSGFFPRTIEHWSSVNTKTQYLITHGNKDEVLSTDEALYAYEYLQNKSITAEYYEYNGRHRMTLPLMKHVSHWIEERI
jgi:predicted esterase